ncbi:hypothetical protein [Mycetocola spongiae]|uniref:hypothetical protein n=1 Tax=Mycetocola spongiae TaxID=2859226 RepID=UPI001CF22ECC|nr:hypothetical protein [Mycetocola spongiae]UCR90174.1 hypothetical protein KXZ72_05800 [Mycetocola spongiae]
MKTPLKTALIAAASALLIGLGSAAPAQAASYGGNVGYVWQILGTPAEGLSDVTFSTQFHPDTAQKRGTYIAHQFSFKNVPSDRASVGYIGLQPQSPGADGPKLRAIFSSFVAGTRTTSPTCRDGADGGAGVSCALLIDADYTHRYTQTVQNIDGDLWAGTVQDETTGQQWDIGQWTVPEGSGYLRNWQGGFIENFSTENASTVQRVDVTVGAPTSAGRVGRWTNVHEYGAYQGQANFEWSAEGRGLHITRGWSTPVAG